MDNDKFAGWLGAEEEGLRRLLAVVSRLDERVKVIVERAEGQDRNLMTVVNACNLLTTRVVVQEARTMADVLRVHADNLKKLAEIERRVDTLSDAIMGAEAKFKEIAGGAWGVLLALATAWCLWRFGLSH